MKGQCGEQRVKQNGYRADIQYDLSILIPLYNWDIRPLLAELQMQIDSLPAHYTVEIVIVDDGSSERFDLSPFADRMPSLTWIDRRSNLGRSATRNQLLQNAHGLYLLFLDADVFPDASDFLQKYLDTAATGIQIICGGRSYNRRSMRGEEYAFYLYKSLRTEALPAEVRGRAPWRYLFTSNIFIASELVRDVPFDERFTAYGYEDIEWALRLQEKTTIVHIDNTCSHLGLLPKSEVFRKMRDSVPNYALLLRLHPEQTASATILKIVRGLRLMPHPALRFLDLLLRKLFFCFSGNRLSLCLFQLDKAVLLAAESRKE